MFGTYYTYLTLYGLLFSTSVFNQFILVLFIEAEQDELQNKNTSHQRSNRVVKERSAPKCRNCGKPRKGHKKGVCD